MSKRSTYVTLTPLPAGITRETVLTTLHAHTEMIDLNPLVEERHPCRPRPNATAEESLCQWYAITDKVNYLPGGLYSGNVTYYACFHDLSVGLQTHCYAPLGLDLKGKWTLGGSLPGEPKEAVELGLGVPKNGLWLREDVEIRCNVFLTNFVKRVTKKAHATLVDRLVEKAHLAERDSYNDRLSQGQTSFSAQSPNSSQNRDSQYPDTRSSIATTTSSFGSPDLHAQYADSKASPPYPNIGPAYQEGNPFDHKDTKRSYQPINPNGPQQSYQYSSPNDLRQSYQPYNPNEPRQTFQPPPKNGARQPFQAVELPVLGAQVTGTSYDPVELPVHDVAPLRLSKPPPPPKIPNY